MLHPGSAAYHAKTGAYELSGSGYNVWFDHDGFYFAWKRPRGDVLVYTRAGFVGKGADPHREVGRMARQSLDGNAPHVNAVGSRLEILDVATGDRETVYTSPKSLQAPNWTPDGKTPLCTSDGLMSAFDLAGREPKVLDTNDQWRGRCKGR